MIILNEKKISKLKNMLIEQKYSLQRRMDTDDEYLERGSLRILSMSCQQSIIIQQI